ncbi:hypothetical protein HMPREF9278_0789 [Mobiluncus mulieris FB024-16]|uniref:hypothetical protein n=1 Tax=Mobiluncus mulieris TaxID=2052 RepID=UPI0001E51BD4|nr:hypothetical protein [Mobiluncus mulieris]EFN92214.1 hypothetical protein HMPREF9278_0789 [Mobiluncus mulieris FB024-16]
MTPDSHGNGQARHPGWHLVNPKQNRNPVSHQGTYASMNTLRGLTVVVAAICRPTAKTILH